MNELTEFERLLMWEAMFEGYFDNPLTTTIAEKVYNMNADDIRAVLKVYANAKGVVVQNEIVVLTAQLADRESKQVIYTDAAVSLDSKLPKGDLEEPIG